MTTNTVMEALSELSEKINDYEFDPAKRTYYGIAIDTAIKELINYERLLNEMINERKDQIVRIEHELAIQNLRYKIFKEGGDTP